MCDTTCYSTGMENINTSNVTELAARELNRAEYPSGSLNCPSCGESVGKASIQIHAESCKRLRSDVVEVNTSSMALEIRKLLYPNGGSYLWGALSGPANATKRQAIMKLLGQKLPKSKCGYHLVFDAILNALNITGETISDRERGLSDIFKRA